VDAIFDWTDSDSRTTAKGKAMLSDQKVEKQEKAFGMMMERTLANVEVYATLILRSFLMITQQEGGEVRL
jgi:hypothetical protein